MKGKRAIAALMIIPLAAAVMSACGRKKEEPPEETETAASASTEPEADHSLVRSFTINDIFGNLYAGDIKFTFPVTMSEFDDGGKLAKCTFEDNRIIFPGGGYIDAIEMAGEYGGTEILFLRAEAGRAPEDFSAYGITLGLDEKTLRSEYGMPDTVIGDPESSGIYVYIGAGQQRFEVEFSRRKISAMRFSQ